MGNSNSVSSHNQCGNTRRDYLLKSFKKEDTIFDFSNFNEHIHPYKLLSAEAQIKQRVTNINNKVNENNVRNDNLFNDIKYLLDICEYLMIISDQNSHHSVLLKDSKYNFEVIYNGLLDAYKCCSLIQNEFKIQVLVDQ
jgi:hypothetical protein